MLEQPDNGNLDSTLNNEEKKEIPSGQALSQEEKNQEIKQIKQDESNDPDSSKDDSVIFSSIKKSIIAVGDNAEDAINELFDYLLGDEEGEEEATEITELKKSGFFTEEEIKKMAPLFAETNFLTLLAGETQLKNIKILLTVLLENPSLLENKLVRSIIFSPVNENLATLGEVIKSEPILLLNTRFIILLNKGKKENLALLSPLLTEKNNTIDQHFIDIASKGNKENIKSLYDTIRHSIIEKGTISKKLKYLIIKGDEESIKNEMRN